MDPKPNRARLLIVAGVLTVAVASFLAFTPLSVSYGIYGGEAIGFEQTFECGSAVNPDTVFPAVDSPLSGDIDPARECAQYVSQQRTMAAGALIVGGALIVWGLIRSRHRPDRVEEQPLPAHH